MLTGGKRIVQKGRPKGVFSRGLEKFGRVSTPLGTPKPPKPTEPRTPARKTGALLRENRLCARATSTIRPAFFPAVPPCTDFCSGRGPDPRGRQTPPLPGQFFGWGSPGSETTPKNMPGPLWRFAPAPPPGPGARPHRTRRARGAQRPPKNQKTRVASHIRRARARLSRFGARIWPF